MGMIFAALAFVVSGFVQYGIEGKNTAPDNSAIQKKYFQTI